MSSTVEVNRFSMKENYFLVSKGAPEVIGNLLKEKPSGYNKWYKDLAI